MSILVAGYHGMHNFGDDLFRVAVEQNTSRLWPGEEVRFIAPASGRSPRLESIYASKSISGAAFRAGAAVSALARSHHLAYCGGSIFQDVRGVRNLHRLAGRVGWASFEALGVSVGPFAHPAARSRVAGFMSCFDKIVVRDNASQSLLTDMGFTSRMGGDLAALIQFPASSAPEIEVKPIVVAPCSTPGAHPEVLDRHIRRAVAALLEHGQRPVVVLALNAHPASGDRHISEHVADLLTQVSADVRVQDYAHLGLRGACDVLRGAHSIIATRLHAAIIGYLASVPMLQIAYHQKNIDFSEDIGLDPRLVVRPGADTASWDRATGLLLQSRPDMSPEAYRERAFSSYLGK